MDYKWDISVLETIFKECAEAYQNSTDITIKTRLAIQLNALGSMLGKNISYNNFTQEQNFLIDSSIKHNYTSLANNHKLAQAINDTRKESISKIFIFKPFILNQDDAVKLVHYSLKKYNEYEANHFVQLITNHSVNINDNKKAYGYAYNLGSTEAINVVGSNNLHRASILAHEVGHTNQFNNTSIDDYLNMSYSFFSETYAILNQLIFLDNIKDLVPLKDNLKERYNIIDNYQTYAYNQHSNNSYKYTYSCLLAFYLYQVYKCDRSAFGNYLAVFNKAICTHNDDELLSNLNIDGTKLEKGFNYYLKEYQKINKMK